MGNSSLITTSSASATPLSKTGINLRASDESKSFAFRCRPSNIPALLWPGLNFLFPSSKIWLEEEVEILQQLWGREQDLVLSQETLAKVGFKRSLTAKRRSLGLRDRR
ncbi:hypothetical protein ABVK25_011876 [Lepraria finkii]|uniref:Uncharacterized protein n=1 Tax=Lepraria finkii TaxID=1340010 RepID=A0ABR4AJN4_9LECA